MDIGCWSVGFFLNLCWIVLIISEITLGINELKDVCNLSLYMLVCKNACFGGRQMLSSLL